MKPKNDIKVFIDFFHDASVKIRKKKPVFVRGKDGNLVRRALKIFSRQQLEALALWFLYKKQKMSPTVGAMLSKPVLEELREVIQKPNFWKELDDIHEKYFREKQDYSQQLRHFSEFELNKYDSASRK